MPVLSFLKSHVKLICFSIIAIYTLSVAVFKNTKNPAGDGLEYVLMAEAIVNHATPDIRVEDVDSYRKEAQKHGGWASNPKQSYFLEIRSFLSSQKREFMDQTVGFVQGNKGQVHTIHFSTYPYFVAPFKLIFKSFSIHPVDVFFIVNGLLLLTVVYLLLFYFPVPTWFGLLFSGLFYFSAVQWYLLWTHPEVFVACFTVIGLFTFEFKNKYIGVFLCAIAATQYQPLALLVLLMVVSDILKKGFDVKNILLLGISSFIVVLPPLFYYYHFSVTNLVKELGFLDTKYIGFHRLTSFFFDLNQGLILSFPLLFFFYIVLYIKDLVFRFKTKVKKYYFWDIVPFLIIILVLIVSTMGNWNHGQSISNRYVVYIGTILLCHLGWLLFRLGNRRNIRVVTTVVLVVQAVVVTSFGGLAPNYWTDGIHKKIAKKVLNYYPALYNPDPYIFAVRTVGYAGESTYLEGVVYRDDTGRFKKAMVNVDNLDKVKIGSLSLIELTKICKGKIEQNNWVYFHQEDILSALNKKRAEFVISALSN